MAIMASEISVLVLTFGIFKDNGITFTHSKISKKKSFTSLFQSWL